MSENGGPFVSSTFPVDEFIDVDAAVENAVKNFTADGLKYVSGPSITQASDGQVWVSLMFERKRQGVTTDRMQVAAEKARQRLMNGG